MIRVLAKWWAKKQYIWKQEVEAATADLHAGLSFKLATEKRAQIEQLNKEADVIDVNIKAVDDKLAKGYWECENGHEFQGSENGVMILPVGLNPPLPASTDHKKWVCPQCKQAVMKLISTATMRVIQFPKLPRVPKNNRRNRPRPKLRKRSRRRRP